MSTSITTLSLMLVLILKAHTLWNLWHAKSKGWYLKYGTHREDSAMWVGVNLAFLIRSIAASLTSMKVAIMHSRGVFPKRRELMYEQ
jgi:hypothetical protein